MLISSLKCGDTLRHKILRNYNIFEGCFCKFMEFGETKR